MANKRRTDLSFIEGDWVFLKLRPHRPQTVVHRICPKLTARYYGPFQVIKKVGATAYQLSLPLQSQIHPVFYVSQVKWALGQHQISADIPLALEEMVPEDSVPEDILAVQFCKKRNSLLPSSWSSGLVLTLKMIPGTMLLACWLNFLISALRTRLLL